MVATVRQSKAVKGSIIAQTAAKHQLVRFGSSSCGILSYRALTQRYQHVRVRPRLLSRTHLPHGLYSSPRDFRHGACHILLHFPFSCPLCILKLPYIRCSDLIIRHSSIPSILQDTLYSTKYYGITPPVIGNHE